MRGKEEMEAMFDGRTYWKARVGIAKQIFVFSSIDVSILAISILHKIANDHLLILKLTLLGAVLDAEALFADKWRDVSLGERCVADSTELLGLQRSFLELARLSVRHADGPVGAPIHSRGWWWIKTYKSAASHSSLQ